jgi:hypothetical protein
MSDGDPLPAREEMPQRATGGSATKNRRAGALPFFSRIFGSLTRRPERPPACAMPGAPLPSATRFCRSVARYPDCGSPARCCRRISRSTR